MRPRQANDAVLSGLGCVTGLGRTLASTRQALARGDRALRPMADALGSKEAAVLEAPFLTVEVPEDLETQIKFLNDAGELAVTATAEAAAMAGLASSPVADTRRGLYLSQVDGEAWSCREFRPAVQGTGAPDDEALDARALNQAAARRVKPFFMLESLKNNAFSFLATMFDLRGANTSVAGLAGATHTALDMGVRSLQHDRLDVALVVAAARPSGGVARAEMDLEHVPQPPGDGAAALVLERWADARARGARPSAVVLGLGAARGDSPRPWHPSTQALGAAAVQALERAGAGPGEVSAVLVPGLGEEALDEALERIETLRGVPRHDLTRSLGHCALAHEALQWCVAADALERGELPGMDGAIEGAVLVLGAGLLGQAGAALLAKS